VFESLHLFSLLQFLLNVLRCIKKRKILTCALKTGVNVLNIEISHFCIYIYIYKTIIIEKIKIIKKNEDHLTQKFVGRAFMTT